METNSRKLVKLLKEDGFEHLRTQGSHQIFGKGNRRVVVPHPKKNLGKGLVRAIYKDAGWL